jgi:hypothetical protein
MRVLGREALLAAAALLAIAGPAAAQRVCQVNDVDCSTSRINSQREQTLKRLDSDDNRHHEGRAPARRNSGWEQFRQEQLHKRSDPQAGCDVKPIISGGATSVVPTC